MGISILRALFVAFPGPREERQQVLESLVDAHIVLNETAELAIRYLISVLMTFRRQALSTLHAVSLSIPYVREILSVQTAQYRFGSPARKDLSVDFYA